MAERCVDSCLFHLPAVIRATSDEWTRGFCLSILARAKRRGWTPTDKQLALMRRLVDDLLQTGEAASLIED